MSTAPRHKLVGGLLLICSLLSLLLFLQARYFAPQPGIDGQALAAAFMQGRFTGGAMVHSHLWHVGAIIVPGMLLLTAGLAAWNFRLCRRQI